MRPLACSRRCACRLEATVITYYVGISACEKGACSPNLVGKRCFKRASPSPRMLQMSLDSCASSLRMLHHLIHASRTPSFPPHLRHHHYTPCTHAPPHMDPLTPRHPSPGGASFLKPQAPGRIACLAWAPSGGSLPRRGGLCVRVCSQSTQAISTDFLPDTISSKSPELPDWSDMRQWDAHTHTHAHAHAHA